MTMGVGQQLLETGFDNASFLCPPLREILALSLELLQISG